MTDEPIQTDYVQFQFPDLPFSTFRIALGTDVEWAMEQATLLADAFRAAFPAASQSAPAAAPPPGAAPAAAVPPAQPQAAQGGGQQHSPWPPVVVATTNDDGTPAQGCSWHKTSKATGSRPRPLKYFDANPPNFPQPVWKCTGPTKKDPSGYCVLTIPVSAPEPAAAGEYSVPPGEPV